MSKIIQRLLRRLSFFFFFQAEDGIRDWSVTGVQTCALPIFVVNPYSTGITYQLIPKAAVDKVPILSMGYGMSASSDGRWFPWVFNFPTNYWSQASAVVRHIGQQEGGLDKLKGKKIVHIFHNSPYRKEANPTLETLARQLGFELTLLAVDHPGQEQGATWLQIRRINPDWIFMSGWRSEEHTSELQSLTNLV